jgi:8-hydroxy-5-deazaflavin:NADPH oxidoreductase
MRIGILGSGLMGGKLGTLFARAGHEVVFSYARSEQKLKMLARDAKGKASSGTPREAAQDADAVLLAVHWSRIDDVLNQAGDLSGKVVITCCLPMNDNDTELVVAYTSSGAEELAKKIPKAKVVLAFNTVPSEVLFSVSKPSARPIDQA